MLIPESIHHHKRRQCQIIQKIRDAMYRGHFVVFWCPLDNEWRSEKRCHPFALVLDCK